MKSCHVSALNYHLITKEIFTYALFPMPHRRPSQPRPPAVHQPQSLGRREQLALGTRPDLLGTKAAATWPWANPSAVARKFVTFAPLRHRRAQLAC